MGKHFENNKLGKILKFTSLVFINENVVLMMSFISERILDYEDF